MYFQFAHFDNPDSCVLTFNLQREKPRIKERQQKYKQSKLLSDIESSNNTKLDFIVSNLTKF